MFLNTGIRGDVQQVLKTLVQCEKTSEKLLCYVEKRIFNHESESVEKKESEAVENWKLIGGTNSETWGSRNSLRQVESVIFICYDPEAVTERGSRSNNGVQNKIKINSSREKEKDEKPFATRSSTCSSASRNAGGRGEVRTDIELEDRRCRYINVINDILKVSG